MLSKKRLKKNFWKKTYSSSSKPSAVKERNETGTAHCKTYSQHCWINLLDGKSSMQCLKQGDEVMGECRVQRLVLAKCLPQFWKSRSFMTEKLITAYHIVNMTPCETDMGMSWYWRCKAGLHRRFGSEASLQNPQRSSLSCFLTPKLPQIFKNTLIWSRRGALPLPWSTTKLGMSFLSNLTIKTGPSVRTASTKG